MVNKGFSLIELILALSITLGIGMIGFQIFRQNERVYRDQNLASESEQNTRAAGFQIADEIRRAGQGVPIYAASFDSSANDAVAVVLGGSGSTYLRIRQGMSNVETTAPITPAEYAIGLSQTALVRDTSVFSSSLGTTTPNGRFVYVWGLVNSSCWTWVRAELTAIGTPPDTITLIPRQAGDACPVRLDTIRFASPQIITLEESVSFYLNSGSIWKATATDMRTLTAPIWGSASEICRDVEDLTFTYFDKSGKAILPETLEDRLAIVRIDTRVRTRSSVGQIVQGRPRNANLFRR